MCEVARRVALSFAFDSFRSAFGDDLSATATAFRAQVDDVIGDFDHVEVVLDDDNSVAFVDELVQDLDQVLDVFEMQTGSGFIEDIEGVTSRFLGELFT